LVPLRFELSVAECDVARSCTSEASAVTAGVSGFTPGGFADVRILAPSDVDANELVAETPGYGYRTPLEVNDNGSFLWQYWWDPPMDLGTYDIEITDRETDRVATSSITFLNSEAGEINDEPVNSGAQTTLTATVLGDGPLNLRAQPTTDSDIIGTAEVGSLVAVTCYARGEIVTLDSNDPGNDLWHLIVTREPEPIRGYATDVFLNTPTGAEPLDDEPPCSTAVVADHGLLTLTDGSDGPTETRLFEDGPLIQGQLIGGATAQPPGATNTYVQLSGTAHECMWDTAQRLDAGALEIEADPNRNYLFVIEQIRDDEIDIRVYDVSGDLAIDEVADQKGCRRLGVLGRDTQVPDWLRPPPP